MKKKIFAVLTAALLAFQCFTGLPFSGLGSIQTVAGAEFEDAVSADSAGMTYEASVLVNGQPLTENTIVQSGATVSMNFEWKLPTNFVHINGTFYVDLSEQLYGISLNNVSIPVSDIAKYTVQGDKLYIELLTGSSGREGGCALQGVIDLTDVTDADDGAFNLQYFGTSVPVRVPEKISGLWVNKEKSGSVYVGGDGSYYQDFKVYVGSNGAASSNVNITDIFDTAAYGSISNVTVDGASASFGTVADDPATAATESGFTILLPTLASNTTSTITYTLKLDKDKVLDNTLTDSQKQNTVTVYGNGDTSKTYTDTDSYWAELPTVYKTGSYDASSKKITWTITVKPSLAGDADFTVTDTPDALITDAVKSSTVGGDLQITKSEMTYDSANKVYTYTYTIDAPEAGLTPTDISNKAETVFPAYPNLGTESSSKVTIPGTLTDFIKKTYTTPANDLLYWNIEVELPKGENISKVTIEDRLYDNDYANSQKYHGDGKPVNLDHDTLNFTVYIDGTEAPEYVVFKNEGTSRIFVGKLNSDGTVNEIIGSVGNQYNGYFNITIEDTKYDYMEGDNWTSYTSTFLSDHKNAEVKLITDIASTYEDTVLSCSNTAYANITIDGSTVSEGSRARYVKDYDVYKTSYPASMNHYRYDIPNLTNPLGWMIGVSSATYEAGDTITVTDTIPDGLEYVADSAILYIASMDGDIWKAEAYQNALAVSQNGNDITFTVNVNSDVITKLGALNENTIKIAYITQMSTAEYADFIVGATDKSYTNSASVKLHDASTSTDHPLGTVTATQTVTPDITKIVKKEITEAPIKEDDKFYAEYKITINAAEVSLFNGQPYEATDTLGSRLTLVDGTPIITPNSNGETISYDKANGNKIKFSKLQDDTTYVITYRVLVDQLLSNEEPLDSDTAAIEELFGNSVSLELSGGNNAAQSAVLNSGTYRSSAYYVYDEQTGTVTISGTKSWLQDSKHPGARPEYIAVKLKVVKTPVSGDPTTSYVTHNIPAPAVDDSGSWSYTISNLLTKEGDGTTYTYTVEEVIVDGYEVAYSSTSAGSGTNANEGITNADSTKAEYNLDIKNTFTAAEKETGSLKVTKLWENDTLANRPDTIKITLEDQYNGDTYTLSLAKDQESVTFTDLPLYVYTRNADNTLHRELREYKITESCDAAYADLMSKYTTSSSEVFTLADAVLDAGVSLSAPAEQTITNTRATTAPVMITKTYENAEQSELAALAAATKFTIYSDAACTSAITTSSPTVSGTDVSVSFSGLGFNTTYYVKETAAPEGYVLSTDIFECKIDNSGRANYRLYGTSDAFSTTALNCVNKEETVTEPDGGDDTPTTPDSGDNTPTTPDSGDNTPTTPDSGDNTPTTPDSGDNTPTTPDSGDNTPTTPDSGDNAPTTPDSGDNTPTTPDSGDNTPTTPDSGDNTPTTPDSGDNTPVTPEDGDNTPVTPEDGDSTPTIPEDGDNLPAPPDDPDPDLDEDTIGIIPDSSKEGDETNPETTTDRLPLGIIAVAAAATFTSALLSFKDKKRRSGK